MRTAAWTVVFCFCAWTASAQTAPTYEGAMSLVQQGQWAQACQALADFVNAHPASPTVPQARAALAKLAAEHPGTALADQAQFDLAVIAFDLGESSAFSQQVSTFLAQHPKADARLRLELQYRQALLPRTQGKLDEARAALEMFAAAHPGTEQALQAVYEVAYIPRRQGKWDEAKAALGKLIADHPGTRQADQALCDLAIIAFDFGDEAAVSRQVENFLLLRPNADPGLRLEMEYRKALVPRTKGRLEEAQAALEKFAAAHPGTDQAMNALYEVAYIPRRQGKWDEAKASLNKLATDHPESRQADQALYDLAIISFDFGDEEAFNKQVDDFLAQRLEAAPWMRLDLGLRKGLILRNNRKPEQAEAALTRFAAAHPGTEQAAQAQLELAKMAFDRGDFAAFKSRAEAFQSLPNQGSQKQQMEMKYYLALLPRMQGDFESARSELKALAAANPSTQGGLEAEFREVILAIEQRDFEGFRKGAEAFQQAHPQLPSYWRDQLLFGLAMIPAKQARWDEAAKSLGDLVKSGKLGEGHQAWATREYAKTLLHWSESQRARNQPQQAQALEKQGRGLLDTLVTSVTAIMPSKHGEERQFMENVLLDALYSKGDFDGLIRAAQQFIAEHPKPTRSWAADLLWVGMAKFSQKPADFEGAQAAFKEIVDAPVVDNQRDDHIPSKAAYWGALVAQRQGDEATVALYLDKIRTAMPDGPTKQAALARLGGTQPK